MGIYPMTSSVFTLFVNTSRAHYNARAGFWQSVNTSKEAKTKQKRGIFYIFC